MLRIVDSYSDRKLRVGEDISSMHVDAQLNEKRYYACSYFDVWFAIAKQCEGTTKYTNN